MKKRSYDGSLTLEQTSTKVIEFERTGWVASGWTVENGKNIVQYELHDEGLYPTPCLFRKKRLKPLVGFSPVASGKMLEEGQPVDTVMYRWVG